MRVVVKDGRELEVWRRYDTPAGRQPRGVDGVVATATLGESDGTCPAPVTLHGTGNNERRVMRELIHTAFLRMRRADVRKARLDVTLWPGSSG